MVIGIIGAMDVEVSLLREAMDSVDVRHIAGMEFASGTLDGSSVVVVKSGVGKVLLVSALNALREMGHAYGIIGGVGPADFYARTVGAMPIEGSSPGIYVDILPEP